MDDSAQQPMQDFSAFDGDSRLIVLGPIYNQKPIEVNTRAIDTVENYIRTAGKNIDNFLAPVAGLSDLKNIIYTYVNQTAKAKQLAKLGSQHFFNWLQTSKVSENKKAKIADMNQQYNNALENIFTLVKMIQEMKDQVIDQIEGEQGDIWDTNGEGRVCYADASKKFGNVKLVPRKRWTPA
jgi:hypothetical protein